MPKNIQDSEYYNDVCVIQRLYGDEIWVRINLDFGIYNSENEEYENNTQSFEIRRFNLTTQEERVALATHLSNSQNMEVRHHDGRMIKMRKNHYDGIKFGVDRYDLIH